MSTTALMALNHDWLQNVTGSVTCDNVATFTGQTNVSSGCYPAWETQYCYPYWSYPVYISSPSRPIKLTLREVERLRDAAHRDRDLRAILERFTPLIEVSVSFEER